MTDRPSTPDGGEPQRPEDATAPLPPADATTPVPTADAAAPAPEGAVPPPVPPTAAPAPGWTPGPVPHGAAGVPAAAPAGPSAPRRLWGEATATTGGRVALVAVAVLATLLLVAGVGLAAALVGHDRGRSAFAGDDRRTGWSQDGQGPGRHQANDGMMPYGMGQRQGQGRGYGQDFGQGTPGQGQGGLGQGRGGTGGMGGLGAAGLGAVLHGEFTTSATGTPAVMVVQTGQVTAWTTGKSLAVRSSDGFSATYVLDASTTTRGTPAQGSTVRVLAAKDGMKAVLVVAGR